MYSTTTGFVYIQGVLTAAPGFRIIWSVAGRALPGERLSIGSNLAEMAQEISVSSILCASCTCCLKKDTSKNLLPARLPKAAMVAVVAGCTTLLLPNGWSSKDQCNLHWFDPVTVSALQIISSSVADMNAWHVDKDSARSRDSLQSICCMAALERESGLDRDSSFCGCRRFRF